MVTSSMSYMTSWNILYPAAGLMDLTSCASSLTFSLLFMLHILGRNTKETPVLSYEVLRETTLTLSIFIEMTNRSIYFTWITYLISPVKVSTDTRRLAKHVLVGQFFSSSNSCASPKMRNLWSACSENGTSYAFLVAFIAGFYFGRKLFLIPRCCVATHLEIKQEFYCSYVASMYCK